MSIQKARVPELYLPVFCKELHQLVRSGIPASEGLSLLREDESDPEMLAWLDQLCKLTDEGMPLAEALSETKAFPTYMTDMVSPAEQTGRLEDTLLSLQKHYDRQNRMKSEIRGAVTVPVVLHGVREASAVSEREGLRMAERAVRQAAVSVYAIDGAYPATYEELKARSGIAVDEGKYTVFYDIFASNLMPEITVVEVGVEP